MSQGEIIRAWKDTKFRRRLSEAELALLPPNPAGALEVTDGFPHLIPTAQENTEIVVRIG